MVMGCTCVVPVGVEQKFRIRDPHSWYDLQEHLKGLQRAPDECLVELLVVRLSMSETAWRLATKAAGMR